MRGGRWLVLLPLCALSSPWIAGQATRNHHALVLMLLSFALACVAILCRQRARAEQTLLFVLLALSWPPALIDMARATTGLGRIGLIGCATLLLLTCLVVRLLRVRGTLPAGRRGTAVLLDAAFPTVMPVIRAELGLLRFALFRWGRAEADAPPEAIPFPGTATGTEVALCLLSAGGVMVETPMLHLLLSHVSTGTIAWGCTAVHVILALYLVGHAKSLLFRPTLLFPDRLEIRLGVVTGQIVPRAAIKVVEPLASTRDHGERSVFGPAERRLYGLDAPNLRLVTAGETLLFRVDDPGGLVRAIAA